MRNVLLLILICLSGCAGKSLKLPDRYHPLAKIQEHSLWNRGKNSAVTIGDTMYVQDLHEYLSNRSDVRLEAVLRHERVHAVRQKEQGLYSWLLCYIFDSEFQKEEELRGWYAKLDYLLDQGKVLNAVAIAGHLDNYYNLCGSMMTKEEALEWATAVIERRWTPEEFDNDGSGSED